MRSILVLILASMHLVGISQVVNSIVVSNDSILVGDPVMVLYQLQVPAALNVSSIDYQVMVDSLQATNMVAGTKKKADADFEGRFTSAENYRLQGSEINFRPNGVNKVYIDTFMLTLYQTGAFTLQPPTPNFLAAPKDLEIITSEFPEIVVGVTSYFLEAVQANKDSMSLEVIKDQMAPIVVNIYTKKKPSDYWIYFLLLGLAILGAIVYWFVKSRQSKQQIVLLEKPEAPAHYFANKQLTQLRKEELWKVGKDKEYQTQLTYTIREYLENRFDIKALESTTEELKASLTGKVTAEQESMLVEILQIADLVKFAKAKPSEDINESFLTKAYDFVKSTQEDTPDFDEQDYLRRLNAYLDQQKKLG